MSGVTYDEKKLKARLRKVLDVEEDSATALKPAWDPPFDSLFIVELIFSIEDLIPFDPPAAKIVRPGGYYTINEAVDDIAQRIAREWEKKTVEVPARRSAAKSTRKEAITSKAKVGA